MNQTMSPLSVISPEAKIAEDVKIGPFCVIHGEVEIGKGSVIESHVEIFDGVRIGENCHISNGASLSGNVGRLEFWTNYASHKGNLIIGDNVHMESNCTMHGEVHIGKNSWFGSNVVVHHGARIGNNCKIASGAIIASIPQDLKFEGEESTLSIGDNTVIREFATLNRGTNHRGATIIGKDCLIMAYVHVAHDCVIGNNVILVNGVNMAGHVEIDDFAIISGSTIIHQFVRIGKHVMVSGGSLVGRDIPPYIIAARYPVQYEGVNRVGLSRRGFSSAQIDNMQDAYRILFRSGANFTNAVATIRANVPDSIEKDEILLFLSNAKRGLIKGGIEKEIE